MENFLTDYSDEEITEEYSKYPELFLLTRSINEETIDSIIRETQDNDHGYSLKSLFLLKQNVVDDKIEYIEEFQNEEEILKMWYTIFGKGSERGIPPDDYPDKDIFIKKAEDIFNDAEIVVKVKEPLLSEVKMIRENQIIYTYLHLAAAKELTEGLVKSKSVHERWINLK